MSVPSTETVTATIEELLNADEETFYRLPAVPIAATETITAALENFRTRDVEAGRQAARWLQRRAFADYVTSRTVLLLGRGRVWGYYALCSATVIMDGEARAAAGVPGRRPAVPATLLAWIARDPKGEWTGRQMFLHALATCREVNALQATAVMVLDAWDAETGEMWMDRGLGLRRLSEDPERLWVPVSSL